MQRRRPATIVDVAALAGVHPGTVSRALNRPEKVAPETVERVTAAARALQFVPNRAAAALKLGRTGSVAVIVPDITNPHFAALVRAVEHAARRASLQVLLVDTGEDRDQEVDAAHALVRDVDGFVVVSPRRLHRELQALRTTSAVFVNRPVPEHASVLLRTAPAVQEALHHLVSLGHRTLAYLPGPSESWAEQERYAALVATGQRCGVHVVRVPVAEPTFAAAESATDEVVRSAATAVLAFNDQVALGVLAGLRARGVSVPGQVSLVGCDDVPMAAMVDPALTTIGMPTTAAGAAAVALLGERGVSEDLYGAFVPRTSTAVAPRAGLLSARARLG